MTNYLRPDELSTQTEIRKAKQRTGDVRSGLETVASIGGSALVGKAASKILPLLSEYVPEDLAYKGINKVMPGLGSFLKNGMKQGLSLKSGLDFLKGEFTKKESGNQAIPNEQSSPFDLFSKYSPKLAEFFKQQIQAGERPGIVRVLAQKEFGKEIQQIEKDHKRSFKDIVDELFEGKAPIQSQQQVQPQQEQQQGQQTQGLDPAVAQIIQQGNVILQKFKGNL